jgi:hypothetical protein
MLKRRRAPLPQLLAAVLLTFATQALADEEFDVSVHAGSVNVKAKGKWHINQDYPWKLVMGEQKLDRSHFALSETTASVSAPKGAAKLRGGVCKGDQCLMFEKDIVVQ